MTTASTSTAAVSATAALSSTTAALSSTATHSSRSALPTPATATTAKSSARQQAILAVVRDEIALHGFENLSMNTLAARAGVVKKTLYNLYGSKDGLLLAAVGELVGRYQHLPEEVSEGFASILASRQASDAMVLQNPHYAIAMLQSVVRVPNEHELVQLLLRDSRDFLCHHLAVEQDSGRLPVELDVEQFSQALLGQAWGAITLLAKGIVNEQQFSALSHGGMLGLLRGVAIGGMADDGSPLPAAEPQQVNG